MNTLAMILSVIGLVLSWIPDWGWLGVVLCFIAVIIGIMGLTNKKTSANAIGMDVAAGIVGIIGICWGISFQIKHAAGGLDSMLLPLDGTIALAVFCGAFAVFFIAQIVGRKTNRIAGTLIALTAVLVLTLTGTTWLTITDRAMISHINSNHN